MQSQPTYDDVTLILRLYELRREEKMREARTWFAGKFRASTLEELGQVCPPGSQQDAWFRMVITYWDMVASFITSGVLNQELFLESGNELLYAWEKIRDLVPLWRQAASNPLIAANIEKVATAGIERMSKANPNAYKIFAARVRASGA